jgi:hypothetical protein
MLVRDREETVAEQLAFRMSVKNNLKTACEHLEFAHDDLMYLADSNFERGDLKRGKRYTKYAGVARVCASSAAALIKALK